MSKPLKRVLDAFSLSKILESASLTRFNSLIITPVVPIRARMRVSRVSSLRKLALSIAGLIMLGSVGVNLASPATTLAANSNTVNFQARLMGGSGAIVPDGTYNVEFKLYNTVTSSGSSQGSCTGDSSCLWYEDYVYNTGGVTDQRINVVDGYLSASLGSINSFPSTINWNQPLYLTMNIGGTGTSATWDGEMNPRMQLTAIPYAFMANELATQTGTYQSTLGWNTQTASRSILLPNLGGTLCVNGESDGCSFGANYIQNGTALQATSNFNISGTGQAGTSFTAPELQSGSGNLTVQAASGTVTLGTSTNLTASAGLTIASGGANTNLTLNTDGAGAINIGNNDSGNSSIQIGDSSGVYSQTINIGNNASAGASTTLNIGSTAGGVLTLQDSGYTETFNGNSVALKANATSNNSTTAFQVDNGSSGVVLNVDTSNNFVGIGTSSPTAELNVSGSGLQPTALTSGNGTAASNVFTVSGALGGNTSASGATGGTGSGVSLQAGTGGTANGSGSVVGGTGGSINIIAGAGGVASSSGTSGSGGQLILKGGSAGSGGATAGSSGSVIVESNGTNSTTAFQVQNASAASVLTVDTTNTRVGIGAAPANGVLTVGTSSTTGASGGIYFGTDTDLYRNASNSLETDGALTVGNNFTDISGSVDVKITPGVTAGSSSNVFLLDGSNGIPSESDVFTANGELGIGNTAPSANLSFGAAGATINVNQSTTGTGGNLTIQGGQGKAGGNYYGGNLYLEAGAGTGTDPSGNVIVQSNGTNTTTAFEVQNAAGTSNLLVADTSNNKIGIAQTASSTGNTLQVTGGITATTGGILVSAGGETITAGGLNLNSTGITNTGSIAGATTYSGSGNLTLSGTNANELAVSGTPLASTTSSLVQLGNVIATGATNGTYLGINAPSGNQADLLNLEENGTVELKLAYNGAITTGTGATINGQTISSAANFTGTLSVGTLGSGGTTQLCSNGGQLSTCTLGGGGSYIYNSATTLQSSANIDIQSVSASNPTVQLEDYASQTADLIDFKNSSAQIMSEITASGSLQGANGSGTDQNGTTLNINGGQSTGVGNGGNIQLQISAPSATSGTSTNSLSTVATFSGINGSLTLKDAADSTTDFQVQGTSSADVLDVDTQNGRVGIGTNAPVGQLNVQSASYLSNQVVINDGLTSTPPSYPNSYLPSLVVQSSETNSSRPLFFGYNTGSNAWAGYLMAGACTSFSVMCLDFGSGSSYYTALESNGSTLDVGGTGDNTFAAINMYTSGSANPVATFATNGAATFENSTNSAAAFKVEDQSNNVLIGADTSGDNVYLGSTGATALNSQVHIADSNSASNIQQVTIGSNTNGSDALTLDGGTGAASIQIGNSSSAHGIEIGTGAGVEALQLGSTSSTSTTLIQGGGSNTAITMQTAANGYINIGTNAVLNKTIDIGSVGGTVDASTVNIATSNGNATQYVAIGNTGSANNEVLIQGGTSNVAIGIQAGVGGTISIGTANADKISIGMTTSTATFTAESGTATTTLFNGATQHTIQLATGAAAQTITIGSTNTTSALTLQAGTGGLAIQSQGTGTLGVGNNAVAQILAIGNATGATSVNLQAGTGGLTIQTQGGTTNIDNNAIAQTINIGNSTVGTALTLQGGGSSLAISNTGLTATANTTTALSVTNGTTTVLNIDTTSADYQSAVTITSGTSGTSGLELADVTAAGGCTGYCSLLGVDSSGRVGVSNAAVSLTSPALAYWDGLNNPTTGSQSYPSNPIASLSGNAAYSSGNGVLLNPATANTSGSINWSFAQVPFEEVQFQFKAGGGNGADGTWFYSYASDVPTTEYGSTASGTLADGYIIYFSEYHKCIGIAYGSYTDGNQCVSGGGTAGDPLAAVTMPTGAINDNNFHNVDIQFFENKIYVRWDGDLVLQYSDVYTRDLSDYQDFGFGARSGGSTDNHYIKGLLVTKLSSATQYNVDASTPLASDLYWENSSSFNTTGVGNLGIGTSNPNYTLDVNGTTALRTTAEQGSTSITACISSSATSCTTTAGTNLFGTGTSFSSAMVGDVITFPDGTVDTITAVSSTTLATVSTSTLQAGSYFIINSGGLQVNNSTTATTENVTIGPNTTFGGNMYTDYLTNNSATSTIPNASYGYDFANTSTSGGSTKTATFNITGLPATEGTTAHIATKCTESSGTCVIIVQINGTQMSSLTVTSGTEYDDYIVIYADGIWRIDGEGPETGSAAVTGYTQGADYAEYIDYSGTSQPQPGDVLVLGSNPDSVTDSSSSYSSTLVGVVSTNPYQVGGTNDGHSVVLALTGRVPVKVSLENGPILPGDPLTSSSTPGVAMKATGPGNIIGMALEGYDGTQSSNEITVQLHVGYDNPSAQNGVLQGDQTVNGNLSVDGNATVTGNETVQGSINVNGGINASGNSSIENLLVGNTLTDSGNLEVGGTALLNTLQSQTGNITGDFSVGGNTSLASLLVGNNLTINGDMTVNGTANIANVNVSGNTTTQTLTINGTLTMGGDTQLTGKVNTRQATIKTFTASSSITAGSAVILDNSTGNAGNVTTTNTLDDTRVIGVAVTSAAQAGQTVRVAISGWVQVNVDTAQVNGVSPAPVQPGELMVTSTTPGTVASSPNPAAGSILGKSTDNQDSNNQVWILITLQ